MSEALNGNINDGNSEEFMDGYHSDFPLTRLLGKGFASVPELLNARAEKTPDKVAVIHESTSYTFEDMWDFSCRFCGFLKDLGLNASETRVVSYMSNAPHSQWAWYGVNLLGGVFVPVNRLHRGAVLNDQLARARAKVLVTEASALKYLPSLAETGIEHVVFRDSSPVDFDAAGIEVYSFANVLGADRYVGIVPSFDSIASLIYTSGTTGRSKACLIPHNQLCRGASWAVVAMELNTDDVLHDWLPNGHIAAQVYTSTVSLISGATQAKFPTFSASKFWEQVESVGATFFCGFGNVGKILLAMPERPGDYQCSLRVGLMAAFPDSQRRAFEERFGIKLFDFYGMTEAEPVTIAYPIGQRPEGSVGRPSPDFQVSVVDKHSRPLPPGEQGRILIRPKVPAVMMRGYEGDEQATLSATTDLWFHSKDTGYLDKEGFLYFSEREKHAIRRAGENISAQEVEGIIRKHPDIQECVVVGIDNEMVGQEVKALILLESGKILTPEAIYTYCEENMARFMLPRYIEVRDMIPYTEVGKLEYEKIRNIDKHVWDLRNSLLVR